MFKLGIKREKQHNLPLEGESARSKRKLKSDFPGHRDTFEPTRRSTFIRKLLLPSLSLQGMSTEGLVRLVKDTAPNKINFPKVETALLRAGSGGLEHLWYGICLRLRGENPETILKPLLNNQAYSRKAWLNIIADFIAKPLPDPERATQYLQAIKEHNQVYQQDPFARLLQSLLLFELSYRAEALEVVENLYLDFPAYSPALSLMASYLNISGLHEGALSFATEALEKCKDNAQALAVLRRQTNPGDWDDIEEKFSHVRKAILEVMPTSILYCKYSMLDPSF